MIVTEYIRKIHRDYQNIGNVVNKSIRYNFPYNNSNTSLYYSCNNRFKNELILIIHYNNTCYLTSMYFSQHNNEYHMNCYIPNEIYTHISALFADNEYSPSKYFDYMLKVILKSEPIVADYIDEIKKHKKNVYKYTKDRPFFETFIRKNMSKKMKKKVESYFESNLAKQIVDYCKEINKSLRFTSELSRRNDVVIALRHERGQE